MLVSTIHCKSMTKHVQLIWLCLLFHKLDGVAGTENATGDSQKKLDVLSNDMFVNSLYNSRACAILVSEENEDPIIVEPALAGLLIKYMLINHLKFNNCREVLCCFRSSWW